MHTQLQFARGHCYDWDTRTLMCAIENSESFETPIFTFKDFKSLCVGTIPAPIREWCRSNPYVAWKHRKAIQVLPNHWKNAQNIEEQIDNLTRADEIMFNKFPENIGVQQEKMEPEARRKALELRNMLVNSFEDLVKIEERNTANKFAQDFIFKQQPKHQEEKKRKGLNLGFLFESYCKPIREIKSNLENTYEQEKRDLVNMGNSVTHLTATGTIPCYWNLKDKEEERMFEEFLKNPGLHGNPNILIRNLNEFEIFVIFAKKGVNGYVIPEKLDEFQNWYDRSLEAYEGKKDSSCSWPFLPITALLEQYVRMKWSCARYPDKKKTRLSVAMQTERGNAFRKFAETQGQHFLIQQKEILSIYDLEPKVQLIKLSTEDQKQKIANMIWD